MLNGKTKDTFSKLVNYENAADLYCKFRRNDSVCAYDGTQISASMQNHCFESIDTS